MGAERAVGVLLQPLVLPRHPDPPQPESTATYSETDSNTTKHRVVTHVRCCCLTNSRELLSGCIKHIRPLQSLRVHALAASILAHSFEHRNHFRPIHTFSIVPGGAVSTVAVGSLGCFRAQRSVVRV